MGTGADQLAVEHEAKAAGLLHAEDLITFGDPLADLGDQLAAGELARGLVGGVARLTDDHAEIQVDV